MITKNEETKSKLLIGIATFIIFRPTPVNLLGSGLGLKFADFTTLILALIILMVLKKTIIPKNMSVTWLLMLLIIEITSLGYSMFIHEIIMEDLFEVMRPILYFIIYVAIYNVADYKVFYNKKIFKIFLVFTVLSYAQLINLFNIKYYMSYIYEVSKSRTMDTSESIWRIAGTFTNPNYFGFFLAFVCCYLFVFILFKKNIFRNFIFLMISSLLLLYTGSRTALISELLSLAVIMLFYVISLITENKIGKFAKTSYFIILLMLIVVYFITPLIYEKFYRYSNIDNISLNFFLRYETWEKALFVWKKHPLIGHGPYKILMDSFDNNYVLILYRTGLLGLVTFCLFIWSNFRKSFKIFKNIKIIELKMYGLVMIGIHVIMVVSMFAAVTYNFIQIGTIYILLIAIQDKIIKKELKNHGESEN